MINILEMPTFGVGKAKEKEGQENKELDLFFEAYAGSELARKLDVQTKEGGRTKSLFTDVDDTFFRAGKEKSAEEIEKKLKEKNIPLIAVTGNGFQGLYRRIESGELPFFDTIIGAVGTEIWYLQKSQDGKIEYKKDEYFDGLLRRMGFERESLVRKSLEFISQMKERRPEADLDFQNPEEERKFLRGEKADCQPYKISFYFYSDKELLDEVAGSIKEKFSGQAGVICEEIGYNRKLQPGETRKKYCLDILPMTKGDAVNYLTNMAGIKQGIVAGDSGNDVGMLLNTDNLNAVLVGGYKAEVLASVSAAISAEGKKAGRRSFQKIERPDGSIKVIYIEPNSEKRKASESILRASEILFRAENISRIRRAKLEKEV